MRHILFALLFLLDLANAASTVDRARGLIVLRPAEYNVQYTLLECEHTQYTGILVQEHRHKPDYENKFDTRSSIYAIRDGAGRKVPALLCTTSKGHVVLLNAARSTNQPVWIEYHVDTLRACGPKNKPVVVMMIDNVRR